MQRATFLTRALLLASVAVLASSCGDSARPTVGLNPPADLLEREAEPAMPAEALTSEEAYERARDGKIEWGRANAAQMDRACEYLRAAGVPNLRCGVRQQVR